MKYKYPRTPHLPWSPGATSDDKRLSDCDHFAGRVVVATIKMDGENTTMGTDYIHARSLDSKNHDSRNWIKKFHSEFRFNIMPGYRICGENLYAKHSIHYKHLPSYFMAFSVWNEQNHCLSWEDTLQWLPLFDARLIAPPVIYIGTYDPVTIELAFKGYCERSTDEVEGYVVRVADAFHYDQFDVSVAKWVRRNHVQTNEHWMNSEIIPNELETKDVC